MSETKTVKAISSFTCWTGTEMVVLNVGDTGEIPARQADDYIEAGIAEEVKGKAAKPASAAAPADSTAADQAPA